MVRSGGTNPYCQAGVDADILTGKGDDEQRHQCVVLDRRTLALREARRCSPDHVLAFWVT